MKEAKIHIYLTEDERAILLRALLNLRNDIIGQGGYGDCVNELILKVAQARKESLLHSLLR